MTLAASGPRSLAPSRPHHARLLRSLTRMAFACAAGHSHQPEAEFGLARELDMLAPAELARLPGLLEATGLGALVASSLPASLPPPVEAAIADLETRTLARGRRLASERGSIESALQASGIAHAWLKGGWIAPQLYRRATARPMADLDLFVPESDQDGARAVLAALGYQATARTWKHEVWSRPEARSVVDPRGEHPDNPRPVELHSALGEAFRGLRLELAFPARGPLDPRGLHLLAHLTVDALCRRMRAVGLVDVGLWLSSLRTEDWSALRQVLAEPHAARFLWPALALAQRELALDLPRDSLVGLDRAVRPQLRAWVMLADADNVGREARGQVTRPLLEILRIWPIGAAERWTVLRTQLLPDRMHLADRDADLAAGPLWPWLIVRHVFGLPALAWRRWKVRANPAIFTSKESPSELRAARRDDENPGDRRPRTREH